MISDFYLKFMFCILLSLILLAYICVFLSGHGGQNGQSGQK